MKKFNDSDFMLDNVQGQRLYHEIAAALPIIDPHNHIDPTVLAANKQFNDIYALWVKHDPYKHRAMRICGIAERLITGHEAPFEKFMAWAKCFALTAGNPLFHWSCMELKTLFGIEEILTEANALQVWETANSKLQQEDFSALSILKKFKVELLCTSDDLLDTLEHHAALKSQKSITGLPSLRSDSIIAFNTPAFAGWLLQLQAITNLCVTNLSLFEAAIDQRLDFFDAAGCLLADHSLDSGFSFINTTKAEATRLFEQVLNQQPLGDYDVIRLQSYMLRFLGEAYQKRQWKMQLHIGAHRYTSTRLRKAVGPAGGYACLGNTVDVNALTRFLDALDEKKKLPKTILYTLNPADNAVFASLTGSFSEDGVQGKIQFGAAWWYNDHFEGISQQFIALSSYGLLGTSIGMTTDSRSILSMVRHQYYRRILCNQLGTWVQEGKLPNDWNMLATLVRNISYQNIKNWISK